ncbi:aquaporin family protein [Methanomicrobium antiquum]|uniref:Aquaporin family protein n=1 Tax=Methanomicrobium antiquum TaxID=487686 RepID=A0AAF0FLN1_9EURY|nr:MIP/aquaporin family protein [Methanomicrobium antiquum]MDD3976795.1 aquaporin family protein [Methanomicrobium sp.]WFN36150.1 aquaporin family protein [Methanomicrobium antiquum]
MISLGKRFTAEAIGTMLLVYFGAGAAAMTLMLVDGEETPNTFNMGIGLLGGLGDWLAIGLAFGITVMAVIYTFGRVSGAHINPAVSIALWAKGLFPAKDMVVYVIAQLIGALLGSILFALSVGPEAIAIGGLGATAPFVGITVWEALLAEIIGTFLLMMVIMGVAVDEKAPPGFAGLAIGLAVAGIITTIGNISGASINPARSFGPMLADLLLGGPNVLSVYWIYVAGPVIGAVLAAFLYQWIIADGE